MTQNDRANEFKREVGKSLGDGAFISGPILGLSNRARISEDSFFIGGPNLVGFMGGPDLASYSAQNWRSLAITSCISPILGVELHIGLALTEAVNQFRAKLVDLVNARIAAGDTAGHNNTLVGLSGTGELLLGIGKDDTLQPTGIRPDKFFLSVHPGDSRTRLNPSVQEFIASIQGLIGEEKVHRIDLWGESSVTEKMRRMPRDINLSELEEAIKSLGGVYLTELIHRFHNGLNYHPRKHFVILTGVSGTGKTSLAYRYAYAVHGLSSLADHDPLFFWCRVRPDWTDPAGLLGHYDVFSEKYMVPPFLEALLTADAYPSSPVFVCLDEMNLARVEYYLADILSAMETPDARLNLHTNAQAYEGDSGVKVAKNVKWPSNLFIIGTINIDETTTLPSPKVLDRAVVIDVSDINIEDVLGRLGRQSVTMKRAQDNCGEVLKKLLSLLKSHQLAFGYRAVEEVLLYVAFSAKSDDPTEAARLLDEQINQKILTKLRGTHEQAGMISELKSLLADMKLSLETVERMEKELGELGSFQAIR